MLFAYPFDREISQKLSTYCLQVELAPDAIASMIFSSEPEKLDVNDDDGGFIKPKRTSQRQRKGAKQMVTKAAIPFDPKSFKKSFGTLRPRVS